MWQDNTQCSRSCGGGNKQQNRSCTNPVPQCGGVSCLGNKHRTVPCNEQHCPGTSVSICMLMPYTLTVNIVCKLNIHKEYYGMLCASASYHSA